MPKFQVVMPHDPAQCAEALDEVLHHDPEFHAKVMYGCHFGDCTGYALIDASSEEEVRGKIPKSLHKRARVVEVQYVTPGDLRAHHEKLT